MNLKASKKHFGIDCLPVYTGMIGTQVQPPKIRASIFNEQRIATLHWDRMVNTIKSGNFGAMILEISKNTDILNDTNKDLYPGILSAKANDEDTPTWHHAMNGHQKGAYWQAMNTEIRTLTEKMQAWDIVDRDSWMNVLPSTWAFCCKQYPDGTIKKLKARLCARGDQQLEGMD
jgi:hypothetical protein